MTKLFAIGRFRNELADYRLLPSRLLIPAAIAVPLAELGASAATLNPATRLEGCAAMVFMIGVFTGAVIAALRNGRRTIRCACFGRRSQTLSWTAPVRNAILASAPVAALLLRPLPDSFLTLAGSVGAFICGAIAWLLIEESRAVEVMRDLQHE
jgi:Methylamine utilisation protein MauE